MRTIKGFLITVAVSGLVACSTQGDTNSDKGPAERLGQRVDSSAAAVGDSAKSASANFDSAAADVKDSTKDNFEAAKDSAKKASANLDSAAKAVRDDIVAATGNKR